VPALIQGRIIWAVAPDPQGRNPKDRPLIILSDHAENLADDGAIKVVGISTQRAEAPADIQVALPWSRSNTTQTQLTEPSFAVCTWRYSIKKHLIRRTGGVAPPRILQQILEKIKQLTQP